MSVKVLLRSTHPKKDGTLPVIIQVIVDRKIKVVSTGVAVNKNQFRPGLENWIVKHPDAVILNSVIAEKRSMLVKIAHDGTAGSRPLNSKTVETFFQAVTQLLEQYEKRNQPAAHTRLTTNLRYLKEAWANDVKLSNLSREWVNRYINYRFEKGNGESTIKKNLQDLSVVLNSLEDYSGPNYFQLASEMITARPVGRKGLNVEEVRMLEAAKLTGNVDKARDMWLFSYYCHGMRFESVVLLPWLNIKNGYVRYQMNKGQKFREIAIHQKLQAIIEKYKSRSLFVFDLVKQIPDAWHKKSIISPINTMMRAYLDRAVIVAGIEKHVTFHTARHTFATVGLTKGLSYSILKDALGHTNYTTTMQYLNSLTDVRINDAIKELGVFD